MFMNSVHLKYFVLACGPFTSVAEDEMGTEAETETRGTLNPKP